jgi:serine protease Do
MKPIAIAAAAVFGVAAGVASQHVDIAPIAQSHAVTAPAQAPVAGRQLPDFSALVEQAGPAVVNISTVQKMQAAAGPDTGMDPSHPLYEFFKRFGTPPNMGPQGPQVPNGEALDPVSSSVQTATSSPMPTSSPMRAK